MKTMGQINFVDLRAGGVIEFPAVAAKAIYNATEKFLETNQELRNFDVMLELRSDAIVVAFIAHRSPGEKVLGGRTSLGRGVEYETSVNDGTIVKVVLPR